MSSAVPTVGPKVHPASREVLPDDPLSLHACEVGGDPELMLRLLVEEYARMGWGTEAIMGLASDPNFLGFHGLLRLFGEAGLRERVGRILARTGVMRVTEYEAPPEPAAEELVQLALPASGQNGAQEPTQGREYDA